MKLPPDLVIFDCDGVLVDSEAITNKVMQSSLARYGLSLQLSEIMNLFVGGTIRDAMEKSREMGAHLPDSWVEETYEEMFAALKAECDVIDGAVEVLDALDAAKIPYAVGSNGPHAKMQITLAKTGLLDRLQGRIISREDVANPKPAPDVYLKAASDLLVEPSRCVVIEDSASGANAAKTAGMFCFGFAAETPQKRLQPICDVVFEDMADLPRLLRLT